MSATLNSNMTATPPVAFDPEQYVKDIKLLEDLKAEYQVKETEMQEIQRKMRSILDHLDSTLPDYGTGGKRRSALKRQVQTPRSAEEKFSISVGRAIKRAIVAAEKDKLSADAAKALAVEQVTKYAQSLGMTELPKEVAAMIDQKFDERFRLANSSAAA